MPREKNEILQNKTSLIFKNVSCYGHIRNMQVHKQIVEWKPQEKKLMTVVIVLKVAYVLHSKNLDSRTFTT
jgi:hypothetical protein